jgi:hypothetical protein
VGRAMRFFPSRDFPSERGSVPDIVYNRGGSRMRLG